MSQLRMQHSESASFIALLSLLFSSMAGHSPQFPIPRCPPGIKKCIRTCHAVPRRSAALPCTVDEAVPCYPSLHPRVRGGADRPYTYPSFVFLKAYLPQPMSQFHRQPSIEHTDRGLAAPRGLAALRSGKNGDIMLCRCTIVQPALATSCHNIIVPP